MCRAVARAIFSPKYRETTLSAISMPAEMPADVTMEPSSATCFPNSTVTSGKASRIQSNDRQCVVARRPFSSPADPNNIDPVQTEVKVSTCAARARSHSSMVGLFNSLRVPQPPGTTRICRGGQFSKVWCGITCMLPWVVIGTGCSATSHTSKGDDASLLFLIWHSCDHLYGNIRVRDKSLCQKPI